MTEKLVLKPGLKYDTDAEIEMNPTLASVSSSTSKDAASVESVSLKFDAQLSIASYCNLGFSHTKMIVFCPYQCAYTNK